MIVLPELIEKKRPTWHTSPETDPPAISIESARKKEPTWETGIFIGEDETVLVCATNEKEDILGSKALQEGDSRDDIFTSQQATREDGSHLEPNGQEKR